MVYVYVGPWSAAATAEETTDSEKATRRTTYVFDGTNSRASKSDGEERTRTGYK